MHLLHPERINPCKYVIFFGCIIAKIMHLRCTQKCTQMHPELKTECYCGYQTPRTLPNNERTTRYPPNRERTEKKTAGRAADRTSNQERTEKRCTHRTPNELRTNSENAPGTRSKMHFFQRRSNSARRIRQLPDIKAARKPREDRRRSDHGRCFQSTVKQVPPRHGCRKSRNGIDQSGGSVR